jgi:hypothetical protein
MAITLLLQMQVVDSTWSHITLLNLRTQKKGKECYICLKMCPFCNWNNNVKRTNDSSIWLKILDMHKWKYSSFFVPLASRLYSDYHTQTYEKWPSSSIRIAAPSDRAEMLQPLAKLDFLAFHIWPIVNNFP